MPAPTCRAEVSELAQFTPRLLSLHRIRTHNTLKHNPSSLFPPPPPSSSSLFYALFLIWTPQCFKNACLLFSLPLSHIHTLFCFRLLPHPLDYFVFSCSPVHFHVDLKEPPTSHLPTHTHTHTTLAFCGLPGRDLNSDIHTHTPHPNFEYIIHTHAHEPEEQCNIQVTPAKTLQL